MPTFPYVIINAFTQKSFGGNPAAIVVLPPRSLAPNTPTPSLDTQTMIAITKSFSQPITVFVAPPATDTSVPTTSDNIYDIRFFANDYAPLICGHGMFATTKAIHEGLLPGLKLQNVGVDVEQKPDEVRFRTASGLVVCARAVKVDTVDTDGEASYAIELPSSAFEELTGADKDRVHAIVAKALHKAPSETNIKYVARGGGRMHDYLMVVLDESEKLQGKDVDSIALLELAPFGVISLSHATPGTQTAFVSRVFAPLNGINEDHVCGSAHTLMLPYYATQKESGIVDQKEAHVQQVGPRGGDLWVTVDEAKGVIRLRGKGKLFARGELTF